MPTRDAHVLDIDVTRIEDAHVRQAFAVLLDFVNNMVGKGFSTQGRLSSARGVDAGSGGASAFKVMIFEGRLAAEFDAQNGDETMLVVPGRLLSITGYAQYNGTAEWRPMGRGSGALTAFFDSNAVNREDRILVVNVSATTTDYRAVAIYKDGDT